MTETGKNSSNENTEAAGAAESWQIVDGRSLIVLRVFSAIAAGLAIFAAIVLISLRLIHCFQPSLLPWAFKSAVPLILIGIAFASLQFAVPRSRVQVLLGLVVAVAFILWGLEQFLSNTAVVALIDDLVVFLFVLDLGIVICGSLKDQKSQKRG